MAPDQGFRLPYHPQRLCETVDPNYSYFEHQESRKCTPSPNFAMSLLPIKPLCLPNQQERSVSCPPFQIGRLEKTSCLPNWSLCPVRLSLPTCFLTVCKTVSSIGQLQVISWQVSLEMVADIHPDFSTSLSCSFAVCKCADLHAP
jgi:hypothetical protein